MLIALTAACLCLMQNPRIKGYSQCQLFALETFSTVLEPPKNDIFMDLAVVAAGLEFSAALANEWLVTESLRGCKGPGDI